MSSWAVSTGAGQAGTSKILKRWPASPGADGGQRRERLRRATAGAHRVLEAMLDDAGCFVSADGYRCYLGAVAPLYAALEAALDAADAAQLVPDWPRRRKLGLILAGLRAAGGQASGGAASDRFRAAVTAPWCAGDVLGALYVLEGATRGGAVLAHRMRDLGISPPPGAACFLDPYGTERGAMWRAFLGWLEAADLTCAEEAALCPRAAATFTQFVAVGSELARGRETPL